MNMIDFVYVYFVCFRLRSLKTFVVAMMAESKQSDQENKYKMSIAIEFGTDGLGVAYALQDSLEAKIRVHDKWKSKKFGTVVNTKTIILFDENHEVVNHGLDAKSAYINLVNQRDTWMLFERFKMSLYGMY